MPIDMTLRISGLRQRIGLRTEEYCHRFDGNDGWVLHTVRSPKIGVLLYWPQKPAYITVRASHGRDNVCFMAGIEALDNVAAEVGADELNTEGLEEYYCLSAVISREEEIKLEFTVATDDTTYCKDTDKACDEASGPLEIKITNYLFDVRHDEQGEIILQLEGEEGVPPSPPPSHEGYVAIDLGNTNSTIAQLPLGSRRVEDIMMLDANRGGLAGLSHAARPTESSIRIDSVLIEDTVEFSDHPDCARWVIGKVAAANPSSNGLILGAKRLLAGPEWEGTQEVLASPRLDEGPKLQRRPIRLRNRIPGELYLCRLFQRFREAATAYPNRLAITYPTTFSSRELRQLIEVVSRAWLRMRVLEQTSERLSKAEKRIGLILDEASAAAFFFLYRRIFSNAGTIPRFYYQYPRGLNMLLYDSGGGTTDIVLVQALVDPKESPDQLIISVLARSGLRDFGGDDITRAVFRLLKAKIAREVSGTRDGREQLPEWPKRPEELNDYLGKQAALIDRYVPTRFDPSRPLDATQQRNRDHTLILWRWAEEVKQQFDPEEGDRDILTVKLKTKEKDRLSEFLVSSGGGKLDFNKIDVARAEIDALVAAPILKSIQGGNELIRKRLRDVRRDHEGEAEPQEVHWIVAAGSAARYPLFEELFEKHLHVPFFKDRFLLERENCKHAVAKGAVLALSMLTKGSKIGIIFDSDLSNRLPFDVAHFNDRLGRYRILFSENAQYSELQEQTVQIVARNDGRPVEYLILEQRWPDKGDFSEFLRFRSRTGIQGGVTVRFNTKEAQFEAIDDRGNKLELEMPPNEIYRSPVQRGDL